MKCDDCVNLLEAYVDGEVGEQQTESVRTHLMTCSACENEFELLTAEAELYARYDREVQISPAVWNGITARIAAEPAAVETRERRDVRGWLAGLFAVPRLGFAFSGAMAVLLVMVAVGYLYTRTDQSPQRLVAASSERIKAGTATIKDSDQPTLMPGSEPSNGGIGPEQSPIVARADKQKRPRAIDDPGVLSADAAYTEIEDRDTASHLEQAQKLLVSFRTLQSDDDQEVDVTYERNESRRLLSENVVLRRDAEMAGKFPTKSVLGSLEPFLIDIANLPDKAPASDVRQIKDRVQRTEIVAELRGY